MTVEAGSRGQVCCVATGFYIDCWAAGLQTDVLELAASGCRVEDIAQRAALSPGTVRNYLSAAATKLGAANRHEAVQKARMHGWI